MTNILDKKISELINLGCLVDLKMYLYEQNSIPYEIVTKFIDEISDIMHKTWEEINISLPRWKVIVKDTKL